MLYLSNLLNYEWELTKSPAGAHQWTAKERRPRRHPMTPT
jgi:catalase-peroxidase